MHDASGQTNAQQLTSTFYEAAFNHAYQALLVLDGGVLVHANEQALRLLRVDGSGALLGKPLSALAQDDQHGGESAEQLCARELQRTEAERRSHFELQLRGPDGTAATVDVDLVRVDWESRWYVVASLRDRNCTRFAEEALRQREQELAEAQRTARVGHWVSDLFTGRVFWSDVMYELLGVTPEAIDARFDRFVDVVHPDDRRYLPEADVPGPDEPEPRSHEYRIIRPDGAVRWVHELVYADRDASGEVVRLHGTLQDVTERREGEEDLKRRIQLERLVRDISTRFLRAHAGTFDEVVEQTLADIARHAGADRCYLVQVSEDRRTAGTTHEWCAEGVPPRIEPLQALVVQDYPWLLEQLTRHEPVEIPSVDALPPDANERRMFECAGSQSCLLAPLLVQGELRAVLGFDVVRAPRHWPANDRELFQISADILAIALSRLALERRLESHAFEDALTGTANRRYTEDALRREVARAERHGERFALVMFDLDHFKAVNDTHGHEVGDQVLRTTCDRVQGRLRKSDLLGRWGGEEFLVLCPDTLEPGAAQLAEDIRQCLEETNFPEAGQVTVSLGVADYRVGEDVKATLKRVDDALYTAKRTGRNRVVVASRMDQESP